MTSDVDEKNDNENKSPSTSTASKFIFGDGGAATFAKLAAKNNEASTVSTKLATKDQPTSAYAASRSNETSDIKKQVSAVMTLHTRQAEQLWAGRKGDTKAKIYPIWGLVQFASEIGKAWHEASLNNPVADYFLVKTEAEYEKVRAMIDSRLEELESMIDGNDIFDDISVAENRQPISHNLVFLCPWGYRGATLLKKLDDIVCKALTARHVGFINHDNWHLYVNDSARALRNFFRSCESFVDIPLERSWFVANDKRLYSAKLAYRHYGKKIPFVPSEIMSGKKRAAMCPSIRDDETIKKLRAIGFKKAKPLMAEVFATRKKERAASGSENAKKSKAPNEKQNKNMSVDTL
jgi:integrating conjugative element protein (TIGR03761 family)